MKFQLFSISVTYSCIMSLILKFYTDYFDSKYRNAVTVMKLFCFLVFDLSTLEILLYMLNSSKLFVFSMKDLYYEKIFQMLVGSSVGV